MGDETNASDAAKRENNEDEKEEDKFAITKAMFELPEGICYMDGNSLGPLPRHARACLEETVGNEWGKLLISSWYVRVVSHRVYVYVASF